MNKKAIIHEFLVQYGGAERCLEEFKKILPAADVFTLIYDKQKLPQYKKQGWVVKKSFVNNFPGAKKHHAWYTFLYPRAIESFDLKEYEQILSCSHAFAKGVKTNKRRQEHICYCFTPMRFAYGFGEHYAQGLGKGIKKELIRRLRRWDQKTKHRPDRYLAISKTVQDRIKKVYNREAKIIYPPADTDFYQPGNTEERREFYLVVSRLKSYKRIDLAVKAVRELNKKKPDGKEKLVVVGEGPELGKLKKIAGQAKRKEGNIRFLRGLSDEGVRWYYQNCRALIFPGEEDFGIVPVEAQACGRPVIAYGKGGARETIKEGETGVFFKEQKVNELVKGIKASEKINFKKKECRRNALRFSKGKFRKKMKKELQ